MKKALWTCLFKGTEFYPQISDFNSMLTFTKFKIAKYISPWQHMLKKKKKKAAIKIVIFDTANCYSSWWPTCVGVCQEKVCWSCREFYTLQ